MNTHNSMILICLLKSFSPPIEEYNSMKRSLVKAKISSKSLEESLENPHFDISDLYALLLEK